MFNIATDSRNKSVGRKIMYLQRTQLQKVLTLKYFWTQLLISIVVKYNWDAIRIKTDSGSWDVNIYNANNSLAAE